MTEVYIMHSSAFLDESSIGGPFFIYVAEGFSVLDTLMILVTGSSRSCDDCTFHSLLVLVVCHYLAIKFATTSKFDGFFSASKYSGIRLLSRLLSDLESAAVLARGNWFPVLSVQRPLRKSPGHMQQCHRLGCVHLHLRRQQQHPNGRSRGNECGCNRVHP